MYVAKEKILVPNARTYIQAENVWKEGDDPFKQKQTDLDTKFFKGFAKARNLVPHQLLIHVEEDVYLLHVKGVEWVQNVPIH